MISFNMISSHLVLKMVVGFLLLVVLANKEMEQDINYNLVLMLILL